MLDRFSLLALIVTSASTAAVAAVSPDPSYQVWLPLLCGCLTALIVRGIVITTPSKKKRVFAFEFLVTALSVLLTGAVIYDRHYTIMYATFSGMGIGALGVSVIGMARSWATSILQNLAKTVLAASEKKAGDEDSGPDDKTPE